MPQQEDDDVTRLAASRVGRVLKGKYTLDRVLGVGGMAAVYAATHRNRKEFAIKMLHPEYSMRETIRNRFLREGYVGNSVKHPGAVAVLDDDVAEDGSAFLVMERLEGSTVEELWEKRGYRLPVATVLAMADQLLDVLAAAHSRGVVHRDLKPPNLYWTRDGSLKVLDFGIARLRDATSRTGTQAGTMLGTPGFMAPEQAHGHTTEIDGQTDLWAVGATMFALITGKLAHDGENGQQLVIAAVTKPAHPIARLAPDVPAPVAGVIDRALAFRKKDRWESAEAMRAAVQQAHAEAFGSEITQAGKKPRTSLLGTEMAEPGPAARAAIGSRPSVDPTWDATDEWPRVVGPADQVVSSGRTELAPTIDLPPAGLKLSTTVGVEGERAAKGPKLRILWVVAAMILLGAGGATVARLGSHSAQGAASTTPSAPTLEPSTPSSSSIATSAAVGTQTPVAPSTGAPAIPEVSFGSLPHPAPIEHGTHRSEPRPGHSPTPKLAPSASILSTPTSPLSAQPVPQPAVNCDPPYTLDAAGHRVPKQECL